MGLFTASMGPRLFSRGMDGTGRTGDRDGPASMGPRLFSRGMCPLAWMCTHTGSGFNGAAAVQPRNAARPYSSRTRPRALQWGRGCSAAECWPSGKREVNDDKCFNGAAAVQPRNAGCVLFRPNTPPPLQWGRGCSAAEWRAYRYHQRLCSTLQWGRGCSAAEWEAGYSPAALREKLQWGRGCSAAEWTPASMLWGQSIKASMGPRLFSRGMSTGITRYSWTLSRFNGAAAVQPRNAMRSLEAL